MDLEYYRLRHEKKKQYDREYYAKNRVIISEKRQQHYKNNWNEHQRRNRANYENRRNITSREPIIITEGTLVKFE